ncbi:MAG: hypothetical protein M3Y28_02675 [Armatimonadota bacterium]|nr:hypothetical protein [Armatimonadota bacterium]
MTLTLDLTRAEQERMAGTAEQAGTDLAGLVHRFVAELPPVRERKIRERKDPEVVARVRNIRGKFAGTAAEVASEELHRERQADKRQEDIFHGPSL